MGVLEGGGCRAIRGERIMSDQPLIQVCSCESNYTIEPHGDAYALYFGRCNHRHGYNIARISECDYRLFEPKELERLLNRQDSST